ncbi:MAG: ATP-binding protein [Nitrospirota bacterium]
MEMCLGCKAFKANTDIASMNASLKIVQKQFKEFTRIIGDRDKELEAMSMELAISLSEVFEALRKISSGDPTVRIIETSDIELIRKLKHIVNLTAQEINEIVDQSHEFAIALAEHFDVLHKVSKGNMNARVSGISRVELLESLKKVTNDMIENISREINKRKYAESALKKARDRLEQRVEERTAELRIANEKLRNEIEERRRVEEDLREAELRYRTVADFTHDWEYWETPDRKLRYVSPSCERITGLKPEEFIDDPGLIYEITIPEDREIWANHHHDAHHMTGPRGITFRIQRRDGEIRWVEHVCQPISDNQGQFLGVRASNRDITLRKRAEDALRDSEQLLLQAHKMQAIGRLAAGVAHEINNPLAIINEKAGLMLDLLELSGDMETNNDKFIGFIRVILENVKRCQAITHRLLGFSRRIDVAQQVMNLNEIVNEVMEFLEKEILFKNIHLVLNLKEDMPDVISDKGQLQQVLLNIVNNAIDAVEKGGLIKIATAVKDESTVLVSITDNGHGIPKNILKHIFEPFFTTKKKGKGTGLGLSISYGIIRKLGGTILVESEVNKGTTFTIEIPRKNGTA